jgi:hypothetical protein
MNVNSIIAAMQQGVTGPGQRLILTPDPEFASTLTLGQIIKGKVLRHYEGERYAVSFGGREKVVDSGVPLRSGEIIYGRVVGLDEKVQLQRVYAGGSASADRASATMDSAAGLIANTAESRVLRLFEQYQARLSTGDLRMLGQLARSAGQPDAMAMSGLVLSKLGMSLEPALTRALYRAMREPDPAGREQSEMAAALAADAGSFGTGINREAVEQLARAMLPAQADERQSDGSTDADDIAAESQAEEGVRMPAAGDGQQSFDTHARQEWLLGRFLLNVQSDGSVAHRLVSFPIWFGDRLVEVEMALFSQHRGSDKQDGVEYRKLVFALDTEQLGHIEISVHVANRNLRVIVAADNEAATGELARYMPDLKKGLDAFGWQLDELSYRTTETDLQGNVLRSVVEHYISQNSLSRLL